MSLQKQLHQDLTSHTGLTSLKEVEDVILKRFFSWLLAISLLFLPLVQPALADEYIDVALPILINFVMPYGEDTEISVDVSPLDLKESVMLTPNATIANDYSASTRDNTKNMNSYANNEPAVFTYNWICPGGDTPPPFTTCANSKAKPIGVIAGIAYNPLLDITEHNILSFKKAITDDNIKTISKQITDSTQISDPDVTITRYSRRSIISMCPPPYINGVIQVSPPNACPRP